MKDYIGNTLSVGDHVVYQGGTRNGGYLSKQVVLGFTPKMVRVGYEGAAERGVKGTAVSPSKLVKYDPESIK